MSENPIRNVAPRLVPPVAREPIHSASGTGDGAGLAYTNTPVPVTLPDGTVVLTIPATSFADDATE